MLQIMLLLILSAMISPNYSVLSENSATDPKLDIVCGTRASCNETDPTVEKWPWVASIYFKDPFANEQLKLCGTATIVSNKHLITVATVFSLRHENSSITSPTDFFAVLGGDLNGENAIIYDIQTIYKYFTPEDPVMGGGLAIIRLVNEIIFTEYIRPICLPIIETNPDIQQDRPLTAISWNHITDGPILFEVNVTLQSEDYCQQFIEKPYPTDKLVCGKFSNETAYKFGNGGPLMTIINGLFTIVGVTDKNIGDHIHLPSDIPDVPIYFLTTESSPHMNWITSVLQYS